MSQQNKPQNKSRWTNSKVGQSKKVASNELEDGWKTKGNRRSNSRQQFDRRPQKSKTSEPQKKELPVLTLPKIENPVYANMIKKSLLLSSESDLSTSMSEPKDTKTVLKDDYPQLRQIIEAEKKTKEAALYHDIEGWARAWSQELKFLHSSFVPDIDYSDFVEVAYSLTPKTLEFRGYRATSKVRPNESYVLNRSTTRTPSYRLNKIKKWCDQKCIPLFSCEVSEDMVFVFDGANDDADGYLQYTPRDEPEFEFDLEYDDITFD